MTLQPAPELRDRMFEIYDLLVGKPGPSNFVLDDPAVHGTGSDPVEWWDGPGLGAILVAQGVALSGARILGADPHALRSDDVGWAYDRFVYRTPSRRRDPVSDHGGIREARR